MPFLCVQNQLFAVFISCDWFTSKTMAVVELATVYQGDTLNGFCRDLAVYQWGLISKEERKMSCLPHAIKFLVTEAPTAPGSFRVVDR